MHNSSFEDSVMIRNATKSKVENWFAGGITRVDIHMEDGIPHVQVEALSRTYAMDMNAKKRSYQNKYQTYTDIIAQLVEGYPRGDAQNMATSDQAAIGALMVQYEETDWAFMKRLAARLGTVILPDVQMDAPRVCFGVPDASWGMKLNSKRYTLMKDRAAYEMLKAQVEGSEGENLHEEDFIYYRVSSGQYCQVGDDVEFKNQVWVVSESVISYAAGRLHREYVLVKRQSLRRKSKRNERIQGTSLEGRVLKRANNMVKVHLDIDDAHDEQGNWWFPYSGEGNNLFHCLPDEGARIKVYFPSGNEKQAIAINSVRGGSDEMKSRTVFQKPATKVFEMPGDAKMQLGDDGVLFKKGTVTLHLDGGNISVDAGEDVLLVAGSQLELGSGNGSGVLESIRMRATQSIAMQTNQEHYVFINGDRVGIKSSKLDLQKINVDYMELLTDEELKQMYMDELAQQQISMAALNASLDVGAAIDIPDSQKAQIRADVEARVNSDPKGADVARSWMGGKSESDQQELYQKKYARQASGSEEQQPDLEQQQKTYDQMDKDRTAVHNWNKDVQGIIEKGKSEGKSQADIRASIPAPPVLASREAKQRSQPGLFQQMLDHTGIGNFLERMAPYMDEYALANIVPQKPDYLSKKTDKIVYFSRYTHEVLIIQPQVIMAELNMMLGIIAVIAAIPTGGESLYLLTIADVVIGGATTYVSYQKWKDLKNGITDSNPSFLGLDQEMLDTLGIGLAVVSLASLMKHGLYKAADKLANGKNVAALDEAWSVWKSKLDNLGNSSENWFSNPQLVGANGVNIGRYDLGDAAKGGKPKNLSPERQRQVQDLEDGMYSGRGGYSGKGAGDDLLSPDGKFIDPKLESDYQKYLARKSKEGKSPRDRLEWKEARDYWLNDSPMARGNAFNKKAVKEDWYPVNELHLSNGKRLDSYDPIKGEIISRKATDLELIDISTFESYLKELKNKYPAGTVIRSNAYPELDGLPLTGKQILEIPESNKNFSQIQEYIDLAKSKYGIEIRFRGE
ncbi:contractile injection system protein, VgrG/Pvc8 family [Paenibacillus sp. MMS18-CY102]|uniref:contractile injection system protein, VgrG/Pvc8 family n=1 Tax=Paenibacillus sp. MMS18-CY102 TaxID=2682849 RepID=UPI001365EB50|nr:contractile injection system protein, VgrG/Pvc8 family [Paenibacillus sp. MMS18-CY102]